MDSTVLLITLASIATPILVTYLYRRTLSPARGREPVNSLSANYKAFVIVCAILPVAGTVGIDALEKIADIDETWFVLFPAAVVMCAVVTDAILIWARRSKWVLLLALPYVAISAVSAAVIIFMLIMTITKPQRMF